MGYTLEQISQFQSTLPRRERRKGTQHIHKGFKISIHAPAKGATYSPDFQLYSLSISIHAPAKGATVTLRPDHKPE